MKRIFVFLLIAFACIVTASAERITEQQALQKAQQFMIGKNLVSSMAKARGNDSKAKVLNPDGFYIFNSDKGDGFVLVSADDQMPDILGYSEKGSLEYSSAPSNVKWLLDYYNEVAKRLVSNPSKARIARTQHPNITPFITTQWGQGEPYNSQCPMYGGTNCITGCVATALAQVINYNKWPVGKTREVEEYDSWSINVHMPKLEPTQFDWDNMTNDDIARLMLYCGQAVQMNYGQYESGASPAMEPIALSKVFGYSQSARFVQRSDYTEQDWDDLIYDELANQRAVIYNGYDQNGGHTFIVHGYKDGQFYINWGWNGNFDGYFALTNLVTGGGTYNNDQSATIGIRPIDVNNPDLPKVLVKRLYSNEETYYIKYLNGPFPSIYVSGNLAGDILEATSINIGLGLYDDKGLVKVLWEEKNDFQVGEEVWFNGSVSIESDVAEGSYRVLPIYRMGETHEWMADGNSSDYYIELKVEKNLIRFVKYPLDSYYKNITDLGVHEIDGLTYYIYKERSKNKAELLRSLSGRYTGDINVPAAIQYEGEEYSVVKMAWDTFENTENMNSLSLGISEIIGFWVSNQLEKLELREGINSINADFSGLEMLDKIEFPKSLAMTNCGGVSQCPNIKTITFKTTGKLTMNSNPDWDENSMPSLTDVYFSMATPPVIGYKEEAMKVNPNVTIHIPKGTKTDYENSDWSAWKLTEDLPEPEVHLLWGYYHGDDVSDLSVASNRGKNDCDAAINVPAAMIAAYKGAKINSIEFKTYYGSDIEYVFITKPGVDYLLKQPVEFNVDGWTHVDLEEPFEITGDELYIGYGRNGLTSIQFWNDTQEAPEGVWVRAMGTDTRYDMVPGMWENLAIQDREWNHPMAIRFGISGDNLPTDIALYGTKLVEENKTLTLQTEVVNRTPEIITSYTLAWNIDNGQETGELNVNTGLLTNRAETKSIELPKSLNGRKHTLTLTVKDVNGVADANPANSTFTTDFTTLPNTTFPRKVVMEEGTGTWCGYCVRGIETIKRVSNDYPDNFIAIALHNNDEMDNMENYSDIANRFSLYPSCIINRTLDMDPDYLGVKENVERLKDGAEAKITASAVYASKDYSSVTVKTETTFGFSDDKSTDYRIAYVVVEDKVGPYVQNNYYSGSNLPASDYMYQWSKMDAKVKMEFNDVARGIYGGVNGMKGSVPTSIKEGENYEYEYSFILPKNIKDKKNIRIVALLIDNNSGAIVNADQTAVVYDSSIEKNTYGFLYNKEILPDNMTLTLEAEEDDWGESIVCETNPSSDPKGGLVLSVFDKSQKTGNAKLEILSNTLNAQLIQWCMGGECVPMNGKTVLEKTFTTDKDGTALVQFDATGIQSKGQLEALLTTTIGNESHSVKIIFEYSDPVQEPSYLSYKGTQLLTNKKYTMSDFSDIKSGSFKILKDGRTIEFRNLDLNCATTGEAGCLFRFDQDATLRLYGTNKVLTEGHYVVNPRGALTITGDGSLTTKSTWYDFWIYGTDFTIDNTTLVCEGEVAIGNNNTPDGENVVVKNSTFKGRELFRLTKFVMVNCDFVSTKKIFFDPEEIGGSQLKYEDGSYVSEFVIEPVEGDFANRVMPTALGDVYLELNKSRTINVPVQNNGTTTVTKVSYVVEINGVAESEKEYTLPVVVNKIGEVFNLPISLKGDDKTGTQAVKLTITKVNGKENSSPDKTISGSLITASSAASHSVVVEEFTGSWCGWCTRGIVGLNMLNNTFGDQVITVAAHSNDPMYINDYGFIFWLTTYYPSCVINRGELMDPYFGSNNGVPFGIENDVLKALAVPAVGSIEVQAGWSDDNKTRIKMKTQTTFGADFSSSKYQIGFLLLADGLKGSGSKWAQNNVYAGSYSGDANLRVIENMPALVTDMEYDHVAIAAWGADKGLSGSVSSPIRADVPQVFTYEHSIAGNQLVQDKEKLSVVALLLDKETGKIINAAKCKIGESSPDPDPDPDPQEGKIFEFRYENKSLDNNAVVEINAEEDSFGFGELNCETNPSSNPKNGLILASKEGKKLSGTATLNILGNSLNPQLVQWCMGGDCVPMNGMNTLTKDFTTDDEGICQVMFDATNIRNEGSLEARLSATIDNETRTVNIKFVYDKTNGINIIYSDDDNAVWYDMKGNRLENAPNRKGVYIRSGKKVVK